MDRALCVSMDGDAWNETVGHNDQPERVLLGDEDLPGESMRNLILLMALLATSGCWSDLKKVEVEPDKKPTYRVMVTVGTTKVFDGCREYWGGSALGSDSSGMTWFFDKNGNKVTVTPGTPVICEKEL